jgi:hypothetical protein
LGARAQVLLPLGQVRALARLHDASRGIGLHALVVAENEAICLTEHELERHPAWRGYAESAGKHPPLRGLLTVR